MKKIIILFAIFSCSFAFGSVIVPKFWSDTDKRLPEGFTQRIHSTELKEEGIKLIKVKDDNTICYITYVTSNTNSSYTPSIDCNFK